MPDPVNFIGNNDIRKVLEVAVVLIDRAKTDTQNHQTIKNLKETLGPAIQFLAGNPGSPPSVVN
jgi:hypothetical protein